MPAALHGKTRFSVGRKGGQKEGEGRMARVGGDESRPGGAGLGCPAADVAMMQATNFGNLHDLTHLSSGRSIGLTSGASFWSAR